MYQSSNYQWKKTVSLGDSLKRKLLFLRADRKGWMPAHGIGSVGW